MLSNSLEHRVCMNQRESVRMVTNDPDMADHTRECHDDDIANAQDGLRNSVK